MAIEEIEERRSFPRQRARKGARALGDRDNLALLQPHLPEQCNVDDRSEQRNGETDRCHEERPKRCLLHLLRMFQGSIEALARGAS